MKNVFADNLLILKDDTFFSRDLFEEWYNNLHECTENFLDEFKNVLGNVEGFYYQLNPTVLKEVVYDAIIGLRKIVISENNKVSQPNPFKIAAHLAYWFIRHKPVMFCQWDEKYELDDLIFKDEIEADKERRLTTIWQIKHVNEMIAATYMIRYIFDFDDDKFVVCSSSELKNVKKTDKFYFQDFDELGDAVTDKLKYHLTYRTITPEILEHFLEGYTLHPAWKLTGKLWEAGKDEK